MTEVEADTERLRGAHPLRRVHTRIVLAAVVDSATLNAGGPGSLRAASGTVTGVHRAITVSDYQGGSESLTGMIETNAAVQPGDSGGPLMNAAGSVGKGFEQAATSDGYAPPS